MKIFVKNMVCQRCILAVENELEKLGLHPESVALGEVSFKSEIPAEAKSKLGTALRALGFEIIDDKKTRTVEKIKSIIIELVQNQNGELNENLSDILSREIQQDYAALSHLFSEIEGTTIEKYFIAQRIEKVKELLVYDELSLSEIAYQLNYSSVGYLSNQFKKITGLTPSHFRNIGVQKRKPLDEV